MVFRRQNLNIVQKCKHFAICLILQVTSLLILLFEVARVPLQILELLMQLVNLIVLSLDYVSVPPISFLHPVSVGLGE